VPKFKKAIVCVCALLCGFVSHASTYVVPEDRTLVDQASVIVVGTVVESHARPSDVAGVETVTTLRVDEVIKGAAIADTISVVEPAGRYNGMSRMIAGIPVFADGESVLLMLMRRDDGELVTLNLALGKFSFARDVEGHWVLVREESEIVGWDSHLKPYSEKRRSGEGFLSFVRDEAKGTNPPEDYFVASLPIVSHTARVDSPRAVPQIAPYTAGSYTIGPARWPAFATTTSTYGRGTSAEPGAPAGGDTAINAAMNAWNNVSGTTIKIAYNPALQRSDTGLQPIPGDGQNTIQFERNLSWAGVPPFTCTPSGYSGTLGVGGYHSSGAGHSGPNGEIFDTITEGDVEMNQGIANCTLLFGNGDFNTAVAHEVGHSIGFRHSDQSPTGSACVGASMECSSQAIMKAFITQSINAAPQTWDQHAAQAVYPGAVICNNPQITAQPQGTTIQQGSSAQLTVGATGTSLTYIWYIGNPPAVNNPVPSSNSASIMVSPTTTTTYWVRVSACSTSVDSNAATVTVNPTQCTNPSISAQPQSTSIQQGGSTLLSVTASGTNPTYQWYVGTAPNTSSPAPGGTSSSISVSPTSTTS
jgi:hypothetical protein